MEKRLRGQTRDMLILDDLSFLGERANEAWVHGFVDAIRVIFPLSYKSFLGFSNREQLIERLQKHLARRKRDAKRRAKKC